MYGGGSPWASYGAAIWALIFVAAFIVSSQHDILVPNASIRRCLDASIVFAWVGSLALAVTVAFDYGVIMSAGTSWSATYWLTLASLVAGATSSFLLGALSLKSRFVLGTLQGWLWPVLAAVGQLVILMSASKVVRSLPLANELESLLVFVLFGTIGTTLLTIGAVITKRSLDASRSRMNKPEHAATPSTPRANGASCTTFAPAAGARFV
jgi:hypothetical protein